MCATCCTYRNGVTPDALAIVIYLRVVLGSSCGGTGGRGGEPCPTKLPHPRKRTHTVCSWVPEWAAGGISPFTFIFISFHAVPFLVSGSAGQDPYPNVLISFCFASMPFLLSGVPLESKSSFIFHACLSRPPLGSVKPLQPHVTWSCLEFRLPALASTECVCVCVVKQGRIISLSGIARCPLLHHSITIVFPAFIDWNELLTLRQADLYKGYCFKAVCPCFKAHGTKKQKTTKKPTKTKKHTQKHDFRTSPDSGVMWIFFWFRSSALPSIRAQAPVYSIEFSMGSKETLARNWRFHFSQINCICFFYFRCGEDLSKKSCLTHATTVLSHLKMYCFGITSLHLQPA